MKASSATHAMTRSNDVVVDGVRKSKVPRESVYDMELLRILVNWLAKHPGFKFLGQWRLRMGTGRATCIAISLSTRKLEGNRPLC
jgi:hypothetical protein